MKALKIILFLIWAYFTTLVHLAVIDSKPDNLYSGILFASFESLLGGVILIGVFRLIEINKS